MKNSKSVNELLCKINATLRNSNPDCMPSGDVHTALCQLADVVSRQQEAIDSSAEVLRDHAGEEHLSRVYHHGAHAGNIYYKINMWGPSSPEREAAVKQLLDEFISGLQIDWRGLQSPNVKHSGQ